MDNTKRIHIRVSKKIFEDIDAISKETLDSHSTIIRRAIIEYLRRQ